MLFYFNYLQDMENQAALNVADLFVSPSVFSNFFRSFKKIF